ncbi:MAG: DNA internalization-related competence protein ComEC/Rec2 [Lysobacteraceae bacterium]|nr:MAG: DNA internalization-related competence protein ComEC/Rec2 [Xanthomonadaceae bacterium]
MEADRTSGSAGDAYEASSPPAATLALLAGVLVVHLLADLPPRGFEFACAAAGCAMLVPRPTRLVGFALLGFAWCALRAGMALDARLPVALEGGDFDVVGEVIDLPLRRADATRFVFRPERVRDGDDVLASGGEFRLGWYGEAPADLEPCSRWQLRLRLKRPRGPVNPGGFDAERHALERGIVATGYVREDAGNRRLDPPAACIDGTRARIAAGIDARVADPGVAALLRALAIGDTRGLGEREWEVARATGVAHLLSISGFHIGIAAMFAALVVRLAWRGVPSLGLRMAMPIAQAPAAFATALGYGLLAGASLPTLRTVLMIAVVALARCSRRAIGGVQALAYALLAILVADPLATLSPGFWLSFGGVALLMLCMAPAPRAGLRAGLRQLGTAQLVMSLGLLPLTIGFFGQASAAGFVANFVAVPLVSFVVVPLCLLAVLALLAWPPLAAPLLALAAAGVGPLWALLESIAQWPGAQLQFAEPPAWALALALVGATWALLPRALPARPLGLLLMLPLLWPPRASPGHAAFEARVIDVGQGLSVLVSTRSHALLYDAGAKYPSGFDLGRAAVIPALHALGVSDLDLLVVSHGDSDHAGGAAAVLSVFPRADRLAGEPARSGIAAAPCAHGQSWRWDGVFFQMLAPEDGAPDAPRADNDRSCVLLVSGAGGRLLLTGDIGRRIEPAVAARVRPGPPLVLVVPHHGSRSSSSVEFVHALAPAAALVSAAWRSRFGHPHPQVVARYAEAGIPLWNTADAGSLAVSFPADGPPTPVQGERIRHPRYWRERPAPAQP